MSEDRFSHVVDRFLNKAYHDLKKIPQRQHILFCFFEYFRSQVPKAALSSTIVCILAIFSAN